MLYSCKYHECCVHCGSKQILTFGINEYPMSTLYEVLKKLPSVSKHKRRKELLSWTLWGSCYVFIVFKRAYVCTFRIYYKYTFFRDLLISEPGSIVFKLKTFTALLRPTLFEGRFCSVTCKGETQNRPIKYFMS